MAKQEIPFEVQITEDWNVKVIGMNKSRYLAQYKGKTLYMTLNERKPSKTAKQLALWWGCIIPQIQRFILETEGNAISPELCHLHICTSILNLELVEVQISGKSYLDYDRFRLSKSGIGDVSEAIEKIVSHYAQRGLYIDLPISLNSYSDL